MSISGFVGVGNIGGRIGSSYMLRLRVILCCGSAAGVSKLCGIGGRIGSMRRIVGVLEVGGVFVFWFVRGSVLLERFDCWYGALVVVCWYRSSRDMRLGCCAISVVRSRDVSITVVGGVRLGRLFGLAMCCSRVVVLYSSTRSVVSASSSASIEYSSSW